jgi:osmotically-inducible protein OsmY
VFNEGVNVEAAGVVITLTGAVPSLAFSRLAEEAAAGVPGVHRVENRLELAPRLTADQETRWDVINRLLLARSMGNAAVRVKVDAGIVTLTGEADPVAKQLAEINARLARGAKLVRNEIAVRQDAPALDDASLRALVGYALQSYASIRELNLDISAREGHVTLRGPAPKHCHTFVELVAETVRGVEDVTFDFGGTT